MAKIEPRDLPRLVGGGWASYAAALVYGSDEGRVRETAEGIAGAAAGADPDPIDQIVLTGGVLSADPARLADEMQAISMFGGQRVVRLRDAANVAPALIEACLALPKGAAFLVIEAANLKKDSALARLAQRHKAMAAIACHADSVQDIGRLIDETLAQHGLVVAREARGLLVSALGADRSLSRSELEKLAMYAAGATSITPDMVTDIVSDAGRHDATSLIDRAFAGDIASIEPEANRIFAAGVPEAVVLATAIGHVLALRRALRGGVDSLRPPPHFSRRPLIERAVQRWTEVRLARAMVMLSEAQLASRRNARLADEIVIRCLWALARL